LAADLEATFLSATDAYIESGGTLQNSSMKKKIVAQEEWARSR